MDAIDQGEITKRVNVEIHKVWTSITLVSGLLLMGRKWFDGLVCPGMSNGRQKDASLDPKSERQAKSTSAVARNPTEHERFISL